MRILSAVLALLIVPSFSLAQDDAKKPKGSYTKKAGDFELSFEFKKNDVVVFKMTNGTDGCTMESKATFEKDGLVKCKVTKFEKMGNFPVEKEVGYEYSFKFAIKKKKLTLSDLDGKDIDDGAKDTVQGGYEPAKKDKE